MKYIIKLDDLRKMKEKDIPVLVQTTIEENEVFFAAAIYAQDQILIIEDDDKSFAIQLPKHKILNHWAKTLENSMMEEFILDRKLTLTDKCEALILKEINIEEKSDAYLYKIGSSGNCTASILMNYPKPILKGHTDPKTVFFNINEGETPSIEDCLYIEIEEN